MIAARNYSNQMRHDQADKANDTDRCHRQRRGQRCGNENQIAKAPHGQADDRGLQFTACQHIQVPRCSGADDQKQAQQRQAASRFKSETQIAHEPKQHATQVLVGTQCQQQSCGRAETRGEDNAGQ